ncbi:N-acetylmuramoyl-L-alanine amidase [Bacteroides sp. 519]|uniref:N-acetylmuramoyl-L-alanine amidase n=1 Tax=Bacteroides sp. 519 TaxID=2302937 RepID=UPI0013D68E0B|nr:N-acetylmuramoyl-L-alanine amidase [Bacteroides sp. 519]NDV59324.1 N-acetylmuramoyl-L-alanine amidase [Bacteroides sp. 519]
MRKISEIIIHCSATYPSQDVSVKDIDTWHKAAGFTEIGYHFVVTRDGEICSARVLSKVGAHCKGHNTGSIGVCYIGGLDADGKPSDTRTKSQKESLLQLIEMLTRSYPVKNIYGHNEYSNKACPCFDVKQEYEHIIRELPRKMYTIKFK